jgi:hypothetical protein
VLRPDNQDGTYYDEFDLVSSQLRLLLNAGTVLVTNWHRFALEATHTTDIAEVFYRNISGEEMAESIADDEDDADDEVTPRKRKKAKLKTVYGTGHLFPEFFSNRPGFRPTLRIDSKLLAEVESDDPGASRRYAAETLREVVATVGKPGKPGEQVRCVVSVQMLTEWLCGGRYQLIHIPSHVPLAGNV